MQTLKINSNALRVVATLALATATGFASPILVSNFSFETLPVGGLPNNCGGGCLYSVGAAPSWTGTGLTGQFQSGYPGNTTYFTSVSDGPTSAYVDSGEIFQQVAPLVVLNEVFTFQVDIGRRVDALSGATADLLINGNRYFATGTAPAPGAWSTFTVTYTGTLLDVNKTITIELNSSPSGPGLEANFDNVRLDGALAATPEPATFLLIGSALLGLTAIRRRRREL